MGYEDRIVIPTPEGVLVEYVLAGLGSRMLAEVIDWLLRILIVFALLVLAALLGVSGTATIVLFVVLMFVAEFVYDVAFEVWGGGRTPAKRWGSLRVVMAGGQPITFVPSVIRNVLRLVDVALTLGVVGCVSIIATEHNQRLGDLAAGTIVIREPRAARRRALPADADGARVVRRRAKQSPSLQSSVPSLDPTALAPAELALVEDFLVRREGLGPDARQRVARKLAATIAPKLRDVPADLSDPEALLELVGATATIQTAPSSVLESLDLTAVSQVELGTVRDFLERRGELSTAARERVARKLADTVGAKVGGVPPGEHPPEALLAMIAEAAAAR